MDIRRALDEDVKKIPVGIRIRHSLWALWSFIPLFGGAFAFFNLSLKDHEEKKTALWGFFYLIPLVLVMSGTSIIAKNDDKNGIVALFWIAGIVHAFKRRSDHLKNMVASAWAVGNPEKQSTEPADQEQDQQLTSNEAQEPDDLDELLSELNSLIGLESVKKDVKELINLLRVEEARAAKGIAQTHERSNHLVFYGNPGTGKTTVARLIAKIYSALGLLSKGHLIETDRAGIVGSFIGETEKNVKAIVSNALGGVLFIDEAYALYAGGGNDYGQRAIDTLIKAMEDHREDLIVIVAGYTDKMEEFLSSNPGMKSRFDKYLYFEDYSPTQLVQIFDKFCMNEHYALADAAKPKLHRLFEAYSVSKDESFGNARLARNVFKKAIVNMASRITQNDAHLQLSKEALSVIEVEDIPSHSDPGLARDISVFESESELKEKGGVSPSSVMLPPTEATASANAGDRSFNRNISKVFKDEMNSRYEHSLEKLGASFEIYQSQSAADASLYCEIAVKGNSFNFQIALGKDWNDDIPYVGLWLTTSRNSMKFVKNWLFTNYDGYPSGDIVINEADPVNDFAILCLKSFSAELSGVEHERLLSEFFQIEVLKRLDVLLPRLVATN
jgi:Holliday junction resolvasome RuvABC ATP-dependent DNA helicase subunit